MGFRFFRRITLIPGITLNLSKGGGSLSFGPRGAKVTVGTSGGRATVGIPGTGLSYTTTFAKGRSRKSVEAGRSAPEPVAQPTDRLDLGFFKRLVTSDDEEALVDGWRELVLGNEDAALAHLRKAAHLADGAFLAGTLALKQGSLEEAATYLTAAAQQENELGQLFAKHDIAAILSLPITEEVSVHVGPDMRGVLLALAETYQGQARLQDAIDCLERLQKLEPHDALVKMSLAELLMETEPKDRETSQRVVQLAEGMENESPIHTALLLYKARALRALGLSEAALEVLSKALSRKKDRSADLLQALRYQLALAYEDLGQDQRARVELQKLYAEEPAYEDVAAKLGL